MKTCIDCNRELPEDGFHRRKAKKNGLSNFCKECARRRHEIYQKRHPDKIRETVLKRYGVTLDQYDEMFAAQNGVCAICGDVGPNGERLAVDHNHKTGKIRGLLCRNCNTGVGNLKDDVTILSNAIIYLEKYR